jgi:hypothetical protein
MRITRAAVLLLAMVASTPTLAREARRLPEVARMRVEHHLHEVTQLADHLEGVMKGSCPHFGSPGEWRSYLDSEIDHVVLLMAHLEQAWIEAKRTDDDDVRRTAKAPRKRVEEARALLDKLSACAETNGAPLSQQAVWQRIEREVPQRQTEIALPD